MIAKNNQILIVEDSKVTVNVLTDILVQNNFEVIGTADKGKTAIDIVRTRQPDLIIMDITLHGEIDGIETAKIINSFADIPIIFLTADDDRHNIERIKEVAPYAYLTKPFSSSNLIETIQSQLKDKV